MFHNCGDERCLCSIIAHTELKHFVLQHKYEIMNILDIQEREDEQSQVILDLQQKIDLQNKEMDELKECIELKTKSTGKHSMYKGEYGEKKTEIILNSLFGKYYTIDAKKVNKKMDIRMIHKKYEYTIGMECKEKSTLTKLDITKFHKDKLHNKFYGGIFLSTEAPISGYVTDIDTFYFHDMDLYIYSNNVDIISITINCYLQFLEKKYIHDNSDNNDLNTRKLQDIINHVILTYKSWNDVKKKLSDLDHHFLKSLECMGVDMSIMKGHLYLGSKSKFKGGREPY